MNNNVFLGDFFLKKYYTNFPIYRLKCNDALKIGKRILKGLSISYKTHYHKVYSILALKVQKGPFFAEKKFKQATTIL